MKPPRRGRHAFTLIELLTVIGIIALLAAILFPVTALVRKKVKQSQCITQLKAIVQALKLYHDDHQIYPEVLSQYAFDSNGDGTIDKLEQRLFPAYLSNPSSFTCPLSRIRPNKGDWGPQNPNIANWAPALDRSQATQRAWVYPLGDTYTMQLFPNQIVPPSAWELHYNKRWTGNPNPFAGDKRLLDFRNPSQDTVVTWCNYHGSVDNAGNPGSGSITLVAFLDGRVQVIPTSQMVNWVPGPGQTPPYLVQPKP